MDPSNSALYASYSEARKRLVRRLVDEGIIRDRAIAAAFLDVPREAFVPAGSPASIYADTTIAVEGSFGKWLTTSSQPTMMAIMLEQLRVCAGDHVLEIGSGTGYNAALLGRIVGPTGSVDSVEVEGEAARNAARSLSRTGSSAQVHRADGADGWAQSAPYNRVISTVAVWDLPDAWDRQCAPDGRIVAPLTIVGGDYSAALSREGGDWVSDSMEPCAFVRFKGRLAHPPDHESVGDSDDPPLILYAEPGHLPPASEVPRWLESGEGDSLHGLGGRNAWDGFALWLLRDRGACRVVRALSSGRGVGWQGQAIGIWDADGMALVTATGRLERFGVGDTGDDLASVVAAWRAAGAPPLGSLRIRIRPGSIADRGWIPRWTHCLAAELPGDRAP